MFDSLYGLYERNIDNKRIILPEVPKIVHEDIVILKDDNNYYIHLLNDLNNRVTMLKEKAYMLSNEEFIIKSRELEKMFLLIVQKIKTDKVGRITLPDEIIGKSDGQKVWLLGQQNRYQLFPRMDDYETYKSNLLQKK